MKTSGKTKRHIAIWLFIIMSVAVVEYYLINKYVTNDDYGKIVEDRDLTTKESDFFSDCFINNRGFAENFYDKVSNLTIPMILQKNQGIDYTKTLTTDEMKNIIKEDMKSYDNYTELYINPSSAFALIIDADKMNELYLKNTGKNYDNDVSSTLWIYNETNQVYYDSVAYGNEDSYPNYYDFSNIKITDNKTYQISYTAYYKATEDDPYYSEGTDQELYSGIITLVKISDKHYHFVSNKITDNPNYITIMKEYSLGYDFTSTTISTTKTVDSSYYSDKTSHKVTINKYASKNTLSNGYAIKVIPSKDTMPTEIYFFENNELTMYQKTIDDTSTFYYFADEVLDAKYIEEKDGEFTFSAYTNTLANEGRVILKKVDQINIKQ